jgi:predicted amidohydrolase YtcJ
MVADLVLINGDILTMNPDCPGAQAVATKNGKIASVGSNSQILSWAGKRAKTLDLRGKTVVPGLIDSHTHMISLGHGLSRLDLRYVSSISEIQSRLKAEVKRTRKGRWIVGRGWDQDRLEERRYPTRWDLDKVSPDNPVLLNRVCGHVSVANSQALHLAKINEEIPSSMVGFIEKDKKTGEPTGLVKEKAVDLFSDMIEPHEVDLVNACRRACSNVAKAGLTSVTCITSDLRQVQALETLRKEGRVPLRICVIVSIECLDELKGKQLDDPFLKLRGVKIFADGSLGARTAAMCEPYADEPSTSGILFYRISQLRDLIRKADEADFQIAVHAIGDKALEQTVKAFQSVFSKRQIVKRRHRVEHASVVNPDLIEKIKSLGLLVCAQPHFIVSDFWVPERLGYERARWTYAFKSLLRNGVRLAGSSDAPVEPLNPLLGIWAAVTNKLCPDERLSVEEALRAYTIDAAYFSFEEDVKGSIEVGKYADLTVLSHNPLKVRPEKIKDIRVEMTIVDGKIIYLSGY